MTGGDQNEWGIATQASGVQVLCPMEQNLSGSLLLGSLGSQVRAAPSFIYDIFAKETYITSGPDGLASFPPVTRSNSPSPGEVAVAPYSAASPIMRQDVGLRPGGSRL